LNMLTGGRPEMIQRLLAQLLLSSQEDRKELAEIMANGDRQSLGDMAHKIKGAARIIQASEVIEHCEALEDACNEKTSAEVITARHQAINAAMIELEHALRAQRVGDK